MSDRVAVFNNGRIEQVDTPRQLYMQPRTAFVASFVGTSNVLQPALSGKVCGEQALFSLRPEHIVLSDEPSHHNEIRVSGMIQEIHYQGAATRLELRLADGENCWSVKRTRNGLSAKNAIKLASRSPQSGLVRRWFRCWGRMKWI